jgi:hypothetical protein
MDGIPLDPIQAAAIAIVVVAVLVGARWLRGGRRLPAKKTFRCARCSTVEVHSNRTIEAWRAGKTKLFCGSCHAKWLQSQPAGGRVSRASGSGCLGMLVLCSVIPVLAVGAFYYAYRIA